MQSYKVPSSQVPGHSYILRHPDFKDGTQGQEYKSINTLWDLFQREVTEFPKQEFLGARTFDPANGTMGEYQWTTTTEAGDIVENFGSGLDHIYKKFAPDCPLATPGQQPLAIYSINRPEWLLAEFAAYRSRRYTVGISDATGVESAEMIINSSDSAVVVCSMDKVPRMLERMRMTPGIKVIVSMDSLACSQPTIWTQPFSAATAGALRTQATALGVALVDMREVCEMGRQSPTDEKPPSADDISLVCYTSGTLAAQKGAILKHSASVCASRAAQLSARPGRNNTYLSFIPTTHCADRYTLYALMFEHVRIGMFAGDLATVIDDFQHLRPTVFLAVPTFLNRLYEKAAAATVLAPGIFGAMARYAYNSKLQTLKSGGGPAHAAWDRILFGRVAQVLGGRVRAIFSGSAPLSPAVQDFFRIALSCSVLQGYGQTETFGGGTLQSTGDPSTGHIGIPMPGVDMRLRSIPNMGFSATSVTRPRGELMIRSACLFSGYLKTPENAEELVDEHGWMATSDIAQFNDDGTVTIIDRIKNCFKTANNLWVASESMEIAYAAHRLVHNIFVYGSPDERDLVAVVSPEREHFMLWAQQHYVADAANPNIPTRLPSYEDVCANRAVCRALTEELRRHAAECSLLPDEHVVAVHCDPIPFEHSSASLYTSTLKLRRNVATEHYRDVLDGLFTDVNNREAPSVSS
ncbi:medium-chain fatty acid-CoA ligase faa2 [Coemansia sp. RSA 1200]|nr:medium-chain fatty acid-CoA ligase faa2 [Coemansia sp. RSA 1200]